MNGKGFNEVISYSFVCPKLLANFGFEKYLSLQNPISQDLSCMRPSLVPSLVNALSYNYNRQEARHRYFEIGLKFHYQNDNLLQQKVITGLIAGPRDNEGWSNSNENVDFYDLKSYVVSLGLYNKNQLDTTNYFVQLMR